LPEVPAAEYVAAKLGPEDLRGFVTSVGPAAGLWLMGAVQRTGDPGAALAWLEALVPVADTRLLPALSGIVSRAPDPAVGVAAAQVVCRTLGAEALYPLLLEAETPARERVLQAVRAESLRFGADLVLESRYVGVRRAVVELLGRIGGEAQVARLRRLAEKDLDSTVRTAAEIAAARIEERRGELMQGMSASPLLRDLVLQFEVAAAAGDAGGEERALRSMVQTSDRGAVLVRRLLDNEVARLRLSGLRVTPENAWSGRLGRMVRVLAGADRAGAENLRTLAQDLQGEAESVVVARGLALCSHGSVVQALADLSRSPFARARIAAVDGLVGRQHVTAYTAVEDLLEDGDASVRAHAAGAVGRLGRREAVTALQRLLGDGNDAVRTAALEALMRLVPAEEAAEIGVAALSDPSGAVRWAAITALVRGRDPVQPAWLASLEPSPGRVVGLAELFAILGVDPQAVQRDGPGEPASDPLETVGRLSRALQGRVEPVSPDVPGPAGNSVLIAAARFEQFLSRDRVELRPGQRVQQGTSDRVEALEALISGRGDPGVLQAVLARNRGGGAEVSATVCLAMGCSQAPGTAEALVDLLSEPSRMEVRLASELALALLGGRAVSAAEAGLDEGMPPALTVRLLRVLGLTGADAGAAVLESRLQDPGAPRELLPATLYAIGLGGRLETVEAALPFLHDPQIQVRTAAADAVAAVGSELLDALVEVLGDDDPVGRQAAVYALGQIPGQQAERLLQQALGDTDPFVRQLAGSALLDRRLR
jgi:HEAT repeat protein